MRACMITLFVWLPPSFQFKDDEPNMADTSDSRCHAPLQCFETPRFATPYLYGMFGLVVDWVAATHRARSMPTSSPYCSSLEVGEPTVGHMSCGPSAHQCGGFEVPL